MDTGLKDIKRRKLQIGDIIAMCQWNYSLNKWGVAGKEYWFSTGEVFFKKGRVQWTGTSEFDHKLYDESFLIIKRGKRLMAKVSKKWNWMELRIKSKVSLQELEVGKLFMHNSTIALKSEYRTDKGAIEAYIIGSGEMFWGGTSTPKEQCELEVIELEIAGI